MEEIFKNLKVLDFTWIAAGPNITRALAIQGATILKVESATRPDILRTTPPFKDCQAGINRSQFAANFNVNKYNLGVNLRLSEGRELIRRVIKEWQPDIIAESFAFGVMKKWGLDYDTVRQLKPEIIYLSTSFYGSTGLRAQNRGFGNLGSSVAGFDHLTGWPDVEPSGLYGAYIDMITPPLGVAALVAALDHLQRTGKGQFIDLAQFECGIHHLAPILLEYQFNGNLPARMGNRDLEFCPHGTFPCKGDDRWISIAVTSEEEWEALIKVMGSPDWAFAEKYSTSYSRQQFEDELEDLISNWTRQHDDYQLFVRLKDAGVPAGVVKRCSDLYEDPQMSEWKFIQYLDHPDIGSMPYQTSPIRFAGTPAHLKRPQAAIGQDNMMILSEWMGMSDEEIGELVAQGVLEFS